MATLSHSESRRLYSWWWDSHISPKNSKWLQENLTDMDIKVKTMIKLIEEDADSFRKRAEMYYRKRPELMKLVEEFYRAYRALAERYDHATGALRQAQHTMAEAFPDQVPSIFMDESPPGSSPDAEPPPHELLPHQGALDQTGLQKDAVDISSPTTSFRRNGSFSEENDVATSKGGTWKSTTGEEFASGWARNVLGYQTVEGKGFGDKVHQEIQQLSEECQKLKNQITRETDRADKAEAEAGNLKDAFSKLESENEALSIQYHLSLEKISSLEADISHIKEDFKKLDDEMLAEKSKSRSFEDQYYLVKKENQFSQTELDLLKERTKKQLEELDINKEELEKLNISFTMECERSTQAEIACMALEKLLSESQEDVRGLTLENKNWVEKATNVEMSKIGLEKEIQRLKEDIGSLNEQSCTSAMTIKSLQDEIDLIGKSKRKLEDEVVQYVEEQRTLQQEILSIKSDKKELEQRHHELTEQIGAVNLNVETLHAMIRELRDGNVELKDLCKKQQDERILHFDSLKFLEKITEKNAALEHTLSTANAELEELRDKVRTLEELCENLNGKIYMHISEKALLMSQIEFIARQMEKLLEKNTLLENSLSDVNVELEGLGGKLNVVEESCRTLRDQNSTLLAEKGSLVTQVESISHSLVNLESRYAELGGKNSNLETEKDQIFREVLVLQHSLTTRNEEYELLDQSTRNQLDALETQIHIVQEKDQHKEDELELEHHKIINAQIEILILQRVLRDMKDANMFLSDRCQRHLETSRCQEDLISDLKQEIFTQKERLTWLSQYNGNLVEGVHQVMMMLKISQECQPSDDTHFKLILLEIENMKTSILDAQYDNDHLAIEKSVILMLLEQYGMNLAELHSEKHVMERELKARLEEILVLQSGKHQLLDLNEKLRDDVHASNQREQVLKAESEILCNTLSDVRGSHSTLQGDYLKLTEENQSYLKKVIHLSEENDMLEEKNSALVAQTLNLEHLCLIFRSYNAERALELHVLSDNMDHGRWVNSGLELEIISLKEKLGAVEVENMNLKHAHNNMEECRRCLVILEDEVKTASSTCQELNLQLETGKKFLMERDTSLLEVNRKFQVVQDKNTELSGKIEDLMMDFVEAKVAREESEKKNLTLMKYNTQKDDEITNLQYNNDTLSRELDKLSEEVEDLKKRENHLTVELGERVHEVKSCEAEIENLLDDIHITIINAATFEEKMFELLLRCESLVISSMIQKEMFDEEISRRIIYDDELKEKLDEMDRENGGLKEELSAYFPLICSLRDFINSLEHHILLLSNHQSMRNCQDKAGSHHFQEKKSNQEGDEDHCAISSVGILELQKLHAKVNALEQLVIDILGRLEHDRYVPVLLAAERENEGLNSKGTKYQEETPMGKDIILHQKKKEDTGIMKDIQLDHVLSLSQNDSGANSRAPSAFGSDETKDQIMELWEAIECNKMEKPSPVTSEHDLECHPFEAVEEEKSVCHASKPTYVKELSIDKIEVTSSAELQQELSGNISEKLSSDAQRLSVLQKYAQDLKMNMESSDLSIAPTSFEFKQVKAQLKEADAVILQLIDTNNRLTRKAEKFSTSSGSVLSEQMDEMGGTSETKKSERALRGSEKIGRLELELQKLEYIWLRLKEEHDYEKARAADRRTRVLLRDYLYGRRDSPRRKEVHFCSCIRPRTKDE